MTEETKKNRVANELADYILEQRKQAKIEFAQQIFSRIDSLHKEFIMTKGEVFLPYVSIHDIKKIFLDSGIDVL